MSTFLLFHLKNRHLLHYNYSNNCSEKDNIRLKCRFYNNFKHYAIYNLLQNHKSTKTIFGYNQQCYLKSQNPVYKSTRFCPGFLFKLDLQSTPTILDSFRSIVIIVYSTYTFLTLKLIYRIISILKLP